MINIDKFKTFVYNVANKDGRGTTTPSQFNSLTEQAVLGYYNSRIGAKDRNGVPMSTYYGNQLSIDEFNDIKEERELLSHLGSVLIPDGTTYDLNGNNPPSMWTFASLTFNFGVNINGSNEFIEREITIVKDNDWGKRTSSVLVPPTMKRPIAKFSGSTITVRPKSIGKVNLSYLRVPATPKWGYTVVNGRPEYDSVTSTDLDAPEEAFNQIAMIYLGFLGIHLREQELVQFGIANENKGI
jgi:hypothetical protein